MTNHKYPIQYKKDGNTNIALFPLQELSFRVDKTKHDTYISAYKNDEKFLSSFIGNRQNLKELIQGLQIILEDKKLKI